MAAPSKKGKRQVKKELFPAIDEYILGQGNKTFNYKQVAHGVGVDDPQALKAVAMRLAELEYDGEIIEVSPGKYKAPSRGAVAVGVFTRRSNGKNSVILEGDDEAIFVAERNSMHALNGDKVKVLVAAHRKGVEPECKVLEILEPNEQVFIGTLTVDKHFATLSTCLLYTSPSPRDTR